MRFIKYVFVFLFVFTACDSNKRALMGTDFEVSTMSSKKIIKKHLAANFDKETIEASLKVSFDNGKLDENFRVQLKMKKDEVIWMKGTKFITVFRLKITPTTVSYYSPYQKDYLEADFSVITNFLGTSVTFSQLQNLLLGQSVFDIENKEFDNQIVDKSYVMTPKVQADLFSILFAVNPINFKLDNQSLRNPAKNQSLEITYGDYFYQDKVDIPRNVNILAKDNYKSTKVSIEYRDIEFDKELDFSHKTPSGYKRIQIK